jgi:alkylation response protein AidB-like acyl-CoA dehydrogenase
MGTAVQQTLSELSVEFGAELAWPWHALGALGNTDHAHAMERYAFLRAATIYGGSDEVQKTVLAKSLLGKAAA